MIGIIDYGSGNTNSILSMLEYLDIDAKIICKPSEVLFCDKLILPGVGSFDYAIKTLRSSGWVDYIERAVLHEKKPILGICLGMQLFCSSSEEGQEKGLNWIDASVIRFKKEGEIKIPHMGWNYLSVNKENKIIEKDALKGNRFYFVHSYHVVCNNKSDVLSYTDYGYKIVSAVSKDNIYGVQFHPEKSHRHGLSLFEKFDKI
jgi:imidazole glycerol-phosphate synthase subunit HisH